MSEPSAARHWPRIEATLLALPTPLFEQALLLTNTLTVQHGETGLLRDVLSRETDHPFLLLHSWLLADVAAPSEAERERLESALLPALFFSFAASALREAMADGTAPFDASFSVLADRLGETAQVFFSECMPDGSPFWALHLRCWDAQAASLEDLAGLDAEAALRRAADRRAPAKLGVASVALACGPAGSLDVLLRVVDEINLVHEVRDELLAIRRDARDGRPSYPIRRLVQATGREFEASEPVETWLGAMVLTGLVPRLAQECRNRLARARDELLRLGLPTLGTYLQGLDGLLAELGALFELKPGGQPAPAQRHPFLRSVDALAQATRRAEAYLLADTSFRESWELQRFTLLDRAEVVGRAFPVGLILECLCPHGLALGPPVEAFFEAVARARFAYFEDFPMPADADDVALALRLCRYSRRDADKALLEEPLGWLSQCLTADGDLPVFLGPWGKTLGWGNECAAVTASVILGLLDYDPPRCLPLAERLADRLLERFTGRGFGPLSHYGPAYLLWRTGQLLARLRALPVSAALQARIERVEPILLRRLEHEEAGTHQDAALLALALESSGAPVQRAWIRRLLKSQRYDGSWSEVATYPTALRGYAGWYSSRLVTTALCYHALRTHAEG